MNNECGFWFWFIRPFAEILAGIAIVFAVLIIYVSVIFFLEWKSDRKRKQNDK